MPSAVPNGTCNRWNPDTINVKTRAHGRNFSNPQPPIMDGNPNRTKKAPTPSPIREMMGPANTPPLSWLETPDHVIAPATPPRMVSATRPMDAVRHPMMMFRTPRILMWSRISFPARSTATTNILNDLFPASNSIEGGNDYSITVTLVKETKSCRTL